MTGMALTKLDVLTGIDPLCVCVAYEFEGKRIEEMPASAAVLRGARPVYEELSGWSEPLSNARIRGDLPANAERYVRRLEELTNTPMMMIGVGVRRQDTIVLANPFNA
jgi:adenylosuccinate synthase